MTGRSAHPGDRLYLVSGNGLAAAEQTGAVLAALSSLRALTENP